MLLFYAEGFGSKWETSWDSSPQVLLGKLENEGLFIQESRVSIRYLKTEAMPLLSFYAELTRKEKEESLMKQPQKQNKFD